MASTKRNIFFLALNIFKLNHAIYYVFIEYYVFFIYLKHLIRNVKFNMEISKFTVPFLYQCGWNLNCFVF